MNSKRILLIIAVSLLYSCGGKQNSPVECVSTFIKASMEHDITKAWSTLSPEAQAFYNSLGEKNRKSGRGILEHDISEVLKFRNEKDFKIAADSINPNLVSLTTVSGIEYIIETTPIDGEYKLKDEISVRNVIKCIAVNIMSKDYYQ